MCRHNRVCFTAAPNQAQTNSKTDTKARQQRDWQAAATNQPNSKQAHGRVMLRCRQRMGLCRLLQLLWSRDGNESTVCQHHNQRSTCNKRNSVCARAHLCVSASHSHTHILSLTLTHSLCLCLCAWAAATALTNEPKQG
mgnify:CR=1 FL=1